MTCKKRPWWYAYLVMLAALVVGGCVGQAAVEPEVLLSEDFEGDWASRAGGWEEEGAIKFELDTTEAHSGQASLRLSPVGTPDLFYGSSATFPGERGPNYRISFWIKATDRVDVGVYNWAEGFGGPFVHSREFVSTLKWRKIIFGGRIGRPGYSGVKPVKVQFQVHNHGKPVTLWIDDLLVEKGPDFITEVGWTPVAEGQNLIPNGSFEVDPNRHYGQYLPGISDRGPDENWQFSPDAAYGSRSLQLKAGPDARHTFFGAPGPPLTLRQPLCFDSADAEFTLAASVKLATGEPSPVTVVLGLPYDSDVPLPPDALATLEMTPTTEWTRHRTTFKLPRRDDGTYFLFLLGGRGSAVLLDGLMLARGTSAEFQPRTPVEATLTSAQPWRVYTPQDPLEFTLRAARGELAGAEDLELTLVNYRQQTIRTVTWEAPTAAGQVREQQVTLPPLPMGCYRVELHLAGQPTVLSEISFSVIPEPRLVPAAQSNYGSDMMALVNTYDWDVAPMVQRLGFRWARLWSHRTLERDGYTYVSRGNMTLEQRLAAGEKWVRNLKRHGLGIMLSIHNRFKYRYSGGEQPAVPKTAEEYADYEDNVRDIVGRVGEWIDAYEIGNEPCLPRVSAAQYARMVRESVRILRETDPTATIISLAGAADGKAAWIEQALAEGATEGVDGISFHYGGQCSPETVERYRQIQEWASRGQTKLPQIWDSEEHMSGWSTRPLKIYLCNTALGMRTFFFEAVYRHGSKYWEVDGALKPGTVANFLAAQLLQTFPGGGFYHTPEGLFIALAHDQEQSVLALWSENYTGTTQVTSYIDPFDMLDPTPRPVEELGEIPDFYRDVHPVTVQVPAGVQVLDTMTVPIEPAPREITAELYPMYLVVPRGEEEQLLEALGAEQTLAPVAQAVQ